MAAPFGPYPPAAARRRRGGVVVPLVLIFIGGIFLLQNTGHLPPTAWLNLWRLWPLVLVLAGLELLFAHRIPWLVLAALALVAMAVGVYFTIHAVPGTGAPTVARTFDTDLGGATQAALTVRFGSGQLSVGAMGQARAGQLASITYEGPADLAAEPRYTVSGSTGNLELQTSGRGGPPFGTFTGERDRSGRITLSVAPSVPITSFIVQTGATDAHLDLSSLRINSVDVAMGAASTWIRVPEHGATTVHISGGASTLAIEVPSSVAAQVRQRGGLSTFTIDQSRFPLAGDGLYRSPNYDSVTDRVDLSLETGVTTIQVT